MLSTKADGKGMVLLQMVSDGKNVVVAGPFGNKASPAEKIHVRYGKMVSRGGLMGSLFFADSLFTHICGPTADRSPFSDS